MAATAKKVTEPERTARVYENGVDLIAPDYWNKIMGNGGLGVGMTTDTYVRGEVRVIEQSLSEKYGNRRKVTVKIMPMMHGVIRLAIRAYQIEDADLVYAAFRNVTGAKTVEKKKGSAS